VKWRILVFCNAAGYVRAAQPQNKEQMMSHEEIKVKPVDANSDPEHISVELSARRTGMSFQRTRMSADRTLMSVIRTSLSLIGFGFTIFQVFQKLHDSGVLKTQGTARKFGETLVYLGIGMLVVGIGYHVMFMLGLRREREKLKRAGLIHAESQFPASLTLTVAILLLGVGIMAIFAMVDGTGPLS
jgi:putative membrane protein